MELEIVRFIRDLEECVYELECKMKDVESRLSYIEKFFPNKCDLPIEEHHVKAPSPEERDTLILETYPFCTLKGEKHEHS